MTYELRASAGFPVWEHSGVLKVWLTAAICSYYSILNLGPRNLELGSRSIKTAHAQGGEFSEHAQYQYMQPGAARSALEFHMVVLRVAVGFPMSPSKP